MGLTERPCEVVAKVDNAAVQDGFELYVHGFIVTEMAIGSLYSTE